MAEKFPQGAAPQENKMGVLPIGRLLTNMAVPMMISMLVQACYNAVSYTHLTLPTTPYV